MFMDIAQFQDCELPLYIPPVLEMIHLQDQPQ